jgi:hypothetical protein
MNPEINARNQAAAGRVRAVTARLSEEELLRLIDPPWSAAALLAHMAFWDRFTLARWLHAKSGTGLPPSIDEEAMELVNQAALREWGVIPPRTAVDECLAAVATVDEFIESIEDATLSRVLLEGRERLIDRSIHRSEHLKTIEDAFPEPLP